MLSLPCLNLCTLISSKWLQRNSKLVEAEIKAAEKDDGANGEEYSKKLTSAIIEEPWNFKSKGVVMDWRVAVSISLPNLVIVSPQTSPANVSATESEQMYHGTVGIHTKNNKTSTILANLENIFDDDVDINIFVHKLGKKLGSPEHLFPVNLRATGLKVNNGNVKGTLFPTLEKNMLFGWRTGEEFCARISISVILNSTALSLLDQMTIVPNSRLQHLENLLNDEICSDLEIIVGVDGNRTSIKCHRAILAAGSAVFRRMFESGMREATGNKIEMIGNSETGVKALLNYLYCRCTRKLHKSSETALEVLKAAEKYNIKNLRIVVAGILMAKPGGWFGVDTALNLYSFTKKLCGKEEEIIDKDEDMEEIEDGNSDDEENGDKDDWNSLRIRALHVLKWYTKTKPKTLLESVKYQEIFGGNDPKLALEISSSILRL